jgi:phosphatidylinositol alpha-1,6-mannosyltransferase
MENFAYDLYSSLGKEADVELIKWSRSNRYLTVVLPYFFLRACWVLMRGNVDIVHAQDGVVSSLGYILSRIFHKPFAVVIHGLDITHKRGLYQAVIPRFVSRADVVFCISRAAADEAIKRGVDESKVQVIPLGITDENHAPHEPAREKLHTELKLGKDTQVLLTVGRLVRRKGVAWFVENALPEIVKQQPEAVYLIVGDGEDRTNIEKAAARANMNRHVKLLGRVEDDMMPMLYNGADVFVQPNIPVNGDIEGFGRVLLEASLCELPVVATGIEGIMDAIVDGKNGILAPPKNTKAFVHAVGQFLGSPEKARQFGASGRRYTLKHYRWEAITKEYLKRYEQLISQAE